MNARVTLARCVLPLLGVSCDGMMRVCVCVIQLVQAENEEKESCCERFLSVLSLVFETKSSCTQTCTNTNQYAAPIKQKEGCSPVHRIERGEQQALLSTTKRLLFFSAPGDEKKTVDKSLMSHGYIASAYSDIHSFYRSYERGYLYLLLDLLTRRFSNHRTRVHVFLRFFRPLSLPLHRHTGVILVTDRSIASIVVEFKRIIIMLVDPPHEPVDLDPRHDEIESILLKFVSNVLSDHRSKSISSSSVKKLTEGLSNTLFAVHSPEDGSVIVKIYGGNSDLIVDRKGEIRFMTYLAQHRMSAPILLTFNNGFIYRYIAGDSIASNDWDKSYVTLTRRTDGRIVV